jgi:hypothetical protein
MQRRADKGDSVVHHPRRVRQISLVMILHCYASWLMVHRRVYMCSAYNRHHKLRSGWQTIWGFWLKESTRGLASSSHTHLVSIWLYGQIRSSWYMQATFSELRM